MEVNDLGQVSGKPKGKIYTAPSLVSLNGEKISSEVHEQMMKQEANVKTDAEYQKEIDDVVEYNEKLKDISVIESYNSVKLNGNSILIRLYKHPPVRKIGNMFIPNKLIVPYQTEGGKQATMESPLQYIHRGVIYSISSQCTADFRDKYKVGEVVDLKLGLNLWQQRTWINVEEYYNGTFDNFFIINENMIEKGSY